MDKNEINGLDPEDIGLKAVMGDRFHDENKKPMVEAFPKEPSTVTKVMQKTTEKAVDASCAPVKEPNWMDNLKNCAKAVVLFGGLSFLIFYWQQAGLMAESIAVPSMCICTALAGFGAGRTVRRGNR